MGFNSGFKGLIRHSNKGNRITRHTVSSSCSKPLPWYCWVI